MFSGTRTSRDQAHSIAKLNNSHAYLWWGRGDALERISMEAVGRGLSIVLLENEWEPLEVNPLSNAAADITFIMTRFKWFCGEKGRHGGTHRQYHFFVETPFQTFYSALRFANTLGCVLVFSFFFINSDGDIKEWHSRSKLSCRVSANRRFISICLSRTARRLHSHPAVLNITMRPVPQ